MHKAEVFSYDFDKEQGLTLDFHGQQGILF